MARALWNAVIHLLGISRVGSNTMSLATEKLTTTLNI